MLRATVQRMSVPRILASADLPTSEAKWISLKNIRWEDPEGKERTWECAERTTRSSSGIDAVAIFTILRSKTNAFPLSTIILEQFRPCVDKYVIEMPAGLIDQGETPEQAAARELEEETGYKLQEVLESSPIIVSDPGMTNANMKLVVASVVLEDQLVEPLAKLQEGEFITTRVVQLATLTETFKEYDAKGFIIDARLFHLAMGYSMAQRVAVGEFHRG